MYAVIERAKQFRNRSAGPDWSRISQVLAAFVEAEMLAGRGPWISDEVVCRELVVLGASLGLPRELTHPIPGRPGVLRLVRDSGLQIAPTVAIAGPDQDPMRHLLQAAWNVGFVTEPSVGVWILGPTGLAQLEAVLPELTGARVGDEVRVPFRLFEHIERAGDPPRDVDLAVLGRADGAQVSVYACGQKT
jgi:hypothetical protein